MAAPRKTGKSAAKAAEVKTETAAPQAEASEPVVTAETAPKEAGRKASEKKTAAKRATVKKVDQKTALHVQFSGKSYSQEELVKMAQDVWKYDLKQKVRALASIELYVKPEENKVYYVMNQEFTGNFDI